MWEVIMMMNKIKHPLIIFAAGLLLLAGSSVGATRAAFASQTEASKVDFSTAELTVQLQEGFFNEETEAYNYYRPVADSSYELQFPAIKRDGFNIGKEYVENVRAKNNSKGGYDEYVRIYLKKSWVGMYGKDTNLDPKLIDIKLESGWIIDDDDPDDEGAYYYYTRPLPAEDDPNTEIDERVAPFIKSVKIDNKIWDDVKLVNSTTDGKVVKNEYAYGDGYEFFIEVSVDAVQAHNGAEAMLGAWGVEAKFEGDKLVSVNGSSETTK